MKLIGTGFTKINYKIWHSSFENIEYCHSRPEISGGIHIKKSLSTKIGFMINKVFLKNKYNSSSENIKHCHSRPENIRYCHSRESGNLYKISTKNECLLSLHND